MRSTQFRFGTFLFILGFVLAACGGGGTESQEPSGSGPATSDGPTGEVVEIRWFCCLGTGDDPAQVEVEQAVADAFNESQDGIHVTLEVVEYEQAYDDLNLQINSPNPPDVVGPAGITGQTAFAGQWLDLQPLVDATGYDLSQFDEQLGRVLSKRGVRPRGPALRHLPVDALLPARHVRRGRSRLPAARIRRPVRARRRGPSSGTSTRCASSPCA